MEICVSEIRVKQIHVNQELGVHLLWNRKKAKFREPSVDILVGSISKKLSRWAKQFLIMKSLQNTSKLCKEFHLYNCNNSTILYWAYILKYLCFGLWFNLIFVWALYFLKILTISAQPWSRVFVSNIISERDQFHANFL